MPRRAQPGALATWRRWARATAHVAWALAPVKVRSVSPLLHAGKEQLRQVVCVDPRPDPR